MTKYRIILSNEIIEFVTEAEATAYKTANNLAESVESFDDQFVDFPVIPDVTPRQFRQALVLSGISATDIVTMIETQPEPLRSLALIEWEYSTAFIRSNPLVNQLAPALGFTSQQLDDLWLLAGTL